MIYKKAAILLIILIFTSNIYAQNINIEPGITVGTSYYLGDVNHARQFYSPGFAFGLAFRQNFNDHYAIRLNVIKAKISGNDADFNNQYQQIRAHTFSNNIYEIGLQGEFNFLPFKNLIKKSNAPYITSGIALTVSNSFRDFSFSIPVGAGYKYSPSKRMTISAEWSFRYTTSDELDYLPDEDTFTKQRTKSKNFDWYSVAGLTITYNFENEKKWCPAYSKKRK